MNLVDKFKNGDIVINCNTAAQANALFDWCTKNGIIVKNQVRDASFSLYGVYVCYRCTPADYELYYADFDYYKEKGYTIIRYLDFFEENTNTIKIKDIVEKYAEYEIDEDKLKELLIEPKLKTVWDLQVGDTYYCIPSNSYIFTNSWYNDGIDNYRRDMGNCFLTREEAEFELERRKVETELLRCGGTRDMMSIGDANEDKYFIMYLQDSERIYINYHYGNHYLGNIYFKSREDAQRAIDEIGEDRIKKYLFYVD